MDRSTREQDERFVLETAIHGLLLSIYYAQSLNYFTWINAPVNKQLGHEVRNYRFHPQTEASGSSKATKAEEGVSEGGASVRRDSESCARKNQFYLQYHKHFSCIFRFLRNITFIILFQE